MHTLLFLEPGHFHATLTLRVPHPGVSPEILVYASAGPELRDFLALVERFNTRAERPTHWRPVVVTSADPLGQLIAERRGDVVVLAGRNGGKARTFHRLHEAGFHVLADKPWLVEPEDLEPIRASLAGWPLTMEIMTGRHDVAAGLFQRLVARADVLGDFRAFEIESVHCLEKLVDGAPLRRPAWFFDVRVQGGGAVDIPTHVVNQAQWLLEGRGVREAPRLDSARAWTTSVPLEAFARITGEAKFPEALLSCVDGDELRYACNAELAFRIGDVAARARVSWQLATPVGNDTSVSIARGTRADVVMERTADTGHRRRLRVRPHGDPADVSAAVADLVAGIQRELPGVAVVTGGDRSLDLTIPPALDTGHESHFADVLDEFLGLIDGKAWPAAQVEQTLAKYTVLAEAAVLIRAAAAATEGAR